MDYEKKYKETIEAVRHLLDANYSNEGIQNWVNENFPELKESEDERIRKTLIEYFRIGANNDETTCNIEDKKILAWLEKQGEPFDDNIITRDDEVLQAISIGLTDAKKDLGWSDFGGLPIEEIQEWIEKQGEQKPADKVKPKYKIGDWIIFDENHNGVYQVEKIDNYRYYLRHYLGYALMSVHFDNELIRPWTIQDANDGDVLVTDDKRPFIYKGCLDPKYPDLPVAYCGIISDGYLFIPEGNHWWTVEKVHPATKEQRDLLFINMKEEGYEWDAKKKELKKIEQKIANKIEPKFNVGDTIVAKDFYEYSIGTIKEIKGEQYIFTDGSGINIDEQDEWQLVKEKEEELAYHKNKVCEIEKEILELKNT